MSTEIRRTLFHSWRPPPVAHLCSHKSLNVKSTIFAEHTNLQYFNHNTVERVEQICIIFWSGLNVYKCGSLVNVDENIFVATFKLLHVRAFHHVWMCGNSTSLCYFLSLKLSVTPRHNTAQCMCVYIYTYKMHISHIISFIHEYHVV